ncbi:MAG: AMP-binding protein [Clostridia bacterium]|nr:AMP-binding protein [Clostridia bacterium]
MRIENADRFRRYTNAETFDKIVDYGTITAMWKHCAEEYSELTAIEFDGEKYSYKTLDDDAAALRSAIRGAGVQPLERVALIAANSYDFVRAYLAVVTAGCTAVVLPAHLDETAVFGCMMKLGAKALVYQPALEQKTAFAKQRIPRAAFIPADAKGESAVPVYEAAEADPCMIMFTGGTTGKSKGALLNHGAVMQGTVNGCYGYEQVFFHRMLLVLPLSHVFGLIRNLLAALYTGSTLFICKNNQDMFRDIAAFRPTMLVVVPALAEMALMLSKKFGRNMLGPDMKYIICGAAAVAPYLVGEYGKMGIALFPGYGLTESANLVSGNPECAERPDSVGLPYPNQELRIQNGELLLRGRNMLDCYVGEDEQAWQDGWFHTGDLARFDDDGFLYITGRIKEVIVLDNGENISPAELEARFNALDFIQDSQVFEDVDEGGRHFLALEVVPRMTELASLGENPMKAIEDALWEVNSKQLPAERVSRIVIRDKDFERSPSMKILRYKKC